MPTIPQLPAAGPITAADELPLSQDGVTRGATVGELLAGTQPAIITATGTLLGRTSVGSGGPEQVAVGTGLAVAGGTLAATGPGPRRLPAADRPATHRRIGAEQRRRAPPDAPRDAARPVLGGRQRDHRPGRHDRGER